MARWSSNLTGNSITASSRVMLPFYPVFSFAVGLSYILGDPERTNTPAFSTVREIMPISNWGFIFVVLALVKVVALFSGSRYLMVTALGVALGTYFAWALAFVVSIADTENASLTAPWLWLMVAIAHYASLQSITLDK